MSFLMQARSSTTWVVQHSRPWRNNGVNNIQGGDSSAVAFDNAGTFTSSAPTGVNIKVPFVNTGSTVVQQGDLNVPNFTDSGTLSVDAGASFNGSGSLQSPIVVSTRQHPHDNTR